jgi:serine/threonine protein kinase/Tfp pilus assembly protein PilF
MGSSLSPGTKLGHYEIRLQIGAGGMGEVYLAQDTELERTVALKVLPEDVAADRQRLQRFIREAKTASALNHPHILTIFEIGNTDATHFIATEFIEGETLRQYMRGARLKVSDVLNVAIQTADALCAAHEASIIHRDIKPENIMLRRRDAYVKVLDFGLAKLIEQPPVAVDREAPTKSLFQTAEGIVVGTVIYMSPEQARGLEVDARTDIWSLGVVLFEMVAACLPFEGSTTSEILAAIINEKEPPPLARFAREVPAELERIVEKALRKDREERYQTAKDLLLDLRRLKHKLEVDAEIERTVPPELRSAPGEMRPSGGQEAVSTAQASSAQTAAVESARTTSSVEYIITEIKGHKRRVAAILAAIVLLSVAGIAYYFYSARSGTRAAIDSIAVLPLVNTRNDPNTEYLSDGISEALINSLTELRQLRVVARSTAFRYKGREVDPQAVGRELKVRAVLMGRVRQLGDALNIQVDLVDATTGAQLWGEQYERKIFDVLAVKQDIAQEVTEKLRLRLSGEERKQLIKRDTTNSDAYQLYLKGRYFWNKRSEEGFKRGIEYFNQAIEKDPNYALAYAGLAASYVLLGHELFSVLHPREAYPKAKAAATKALELDETLAEAHAVLAKARFRYDWDWLGAEREFKRAIELDPGYATVHQWYSHLLLPIGRPEESLAESKLALELDPLSLIINLHLGWHYLYVRQYDKAIEQLRKTLELDPNFALALLFLGQAYEQKAMHSEAIVEFQKAISLSRGGPVHVAALGHAYAVSGKRGEAQKVLERLIELSKRRYVPSYEISVIYAGLGDKEQAFAWLQKAYEERDSSWLGDVNVDPRFDDLRSDPRFTDLLRRLGLVEN